VTTPLVSLLVAAADNGVIGLDNRLPWHLPDDLRHFKALTLGKPILMGRKTFSSIGKPLPDRTNLVLTRAPEWRHPGVTAVRSLEEALELAAGAPELVVIGGAEVYRLALPLARRIYLTRVHTSVSGDTYLPELDAGWREVARQSHPVDARHAHAMTFLTLERLAGP
jgi:dihydrofolate reductase